MKVEQKLVNPVKVLERVASVLPEKVKEHVISESLGMIPWDHV